MSMSDSLVVGSRYRLCVKNESYTGRVCECIEYVEESGRWAVRMTDLVPILIRVKAASLCAISTDEEECAICLEAMDCNTATLMCGHRLHFNCTNDLRIRGLETPRCPSCRAPLSESPSAEWLHHTAEENVCNSLAIMYMLRSRHRNLACDSNKAMSFALHTFTASYRKDVLASENACSSLQRGLALYTKERTHSSASSATDSLAYALALHLPDTTWKKTFHAYLLTISPSRDVWTQYAEELTCLLAR